MTRLCLAILSLFLVHAPALALGFEPGASRVATLTMRSTVRVPAGTTLHVSHVVRGDTIGSALSGWLLDLPLGREPLKTEHGWVTIDQDEVRRVLNQSGADPSTYLLRGLHAEVRALPEAGPSIDAAQGRAHSESNQPRMERLDPDTLRDRIEHRVRTMYDVAAQDLRLGFRENDTAVLDEPIRGRTVHIEPIGSSREVPLTVTIYDDDRIDLHTTIRVRVLVQREVLRLNSPVRRSEKLHPEAWTSELAWVPASEQHADSVTIHNAVATAALNAGEVILARHIEAPIVVRRGDLITVHCVSGSVIVKMEARATQDARAGERIELTAGTSRRTNSDTARFQARILSAGVAVSVVQDQPGVAQTNAPDRTIQSDTTTPARPDDAATDRETQP